MTIHRVRLGPDLLQGARDDSPLTLVGIAIAVFYALLPLCLLCFATWDLVVALQTHNTWAWNDFWQMDRGIGQMMLLAIMGPLLIAALDGIKLYERTARRYALLGDDHWAPALDVQPTLLTSTEQAQTSLDFGTIYAPKANMAIVYMVIGVVLVAIGGGLAWLFIWIAQQALPAPPSYELLAAVVAILASVTVVGCVFWGFWLFGRGIRLNAGVSLLGDDAALHIYTRRGRERTRIAWHEIRAFAAQLPARGSDRTTYYLDTGDRVLIWSESLFDPSTK